MSDQFEGSCLCGAARFVATGQPESVAWCHCEKLPQASQGAGLRLRGVQAQRVCCYLRSVNQVQFVARQVARILREMRVDIDLRERPLAE